MDVDAAELSDSVGCILNEADEVAAEVSMNLRSVDVGKVVRTWSNGPEGGNRAGANTSKDMVEVLCRKKVVGLVRGTGEVPLFGVKFGVMGSRSAHAVDEASVKEIRLCQRCYYLSCNDREKAICPPLTRETTVPRVVNMFVTGIKSLRTKLCWVYHWPCGLKRMPLIGGLYLVD